MMKFRFRLRVQLIAYCVFATPPLLMAQDIGSLFIFDHEIMLDKDVLISMVTDLSVGPNGDILITDGGSREVFLFDSKGALKTRLDPAKCHPGFNFFPISAELGREHLFLMNSSPWGYVFDSEAGCFSSVDDSFRPMNFFEFISDTTLVGVRKGSNSKQEMHWFDLNGIMLKHIVLPDQKFPNIDRRVWHGGVATGEEGTYWAPAISPTLLYVLEDTITEIDLNLFFDHQHPAEVLPDNVSISELMKKMGPIISGSTHSEGLFILPDGKLLAQYLTPLGKGRSIWTRLFFDDGNFSHAEVHTSDLGFKDVADGYGYEVVSPSTQDDNYKLRVYRYQRN